MKVVQLLPGMHVGGVERGVVELSRALVRDGMESVVISRPGELSGAIGDDGGVHIPFNCGGKNIVTFPSRVFALRALLERLRPDIVHVRSRLPAWLLRFCRGVGDFSVVSTFHGLYSVGAYSRQMAQADAIICPSNASVAHVRRHYPQAAEKLHLIHRGVDFFYFDPATADIGYCDDFRRQQRWQGCKVVAIVGRMSALKGHALLLHAFARIHAAAPDLRLLVVGNESGGRRTERLQQLARQLGLQDKVFFAGVQRRMREMYRLADIVVSSSTKPEAFGRTMAEALAMNCAVVAAAHGGALDIVQDGKNGILFPPDDEAALAAALTRAATTEWCGLRQSVVVFSLQQMTAKTIAVYRTLANKEPLA